MKVKLIAAAVGLLFLLLVPVAVYGEESKPIPDAIQAKYWKLVALQYKAGNVKTAAKAKADAEHDAVIRRLVDELNKLATEAVKATGCAEVVETDDGLGCKK